MIPITRFIPKFVAAGMAVSVTAFATPANAVEYGHFYNLMALDISYESCMNRAFEAVRAVSTSNPRRSDQGFRGDFGNNVIVNVSCVGAGQGSTVSIVTVYVEPSQAGDIFNRLKKAFFQ